jgi:hypothetical protein
MVHWYPYVPVGGELAVNCAVLSYNGVVYFGFSGDAQVAPDLGRLEKFLKLSFKELHSAAVIKAAPKRRLKREKVVLPKPAALSTRTVGMSTPEDIQPSDESTATSEREKVVEPTVRARSAGGSV